MQIICVPFTTTGVLKLGVLKLEAQSILTYPNHMQLDVNDIVLRYKSSISAQSVNIQATNVHIEGEAVIDTMGRGPGAETGDGGGFRLEGSLVGTGGGHGGYGGGADLLNYTSGTARCILLIILTTKRTLYNQLKPLNNKV